MKTSENSGWPPANNSLLTLIGLGALAWLTSAFALAAPEKNPAALLSSKYAALSNELRSNQFQRPLSLDSAESSNRLKGNVYALVDYPFTAVNAALQVPSNWCNILILHLNTKYCKDTSNQGSSVLKMALGKKMAQPLDAAYEVELDYRVTHSDRNYLGVQLSAEEGPMGTSNYRILLEAIPVGSKQTFLHLTYSYAYGLAGGLAMKAYLASAGRNKVGFSVTGDQSNPRPHYIGGVRGMVERNTMRYYLAIDTYLGALSLPPGKQLNKRLQDWFSATERYPRQLREISRNAYLSMKQEELARMDLM